MNYYPRHLGDYARDAGHLTLAEHGAYTLLLDRYYATERPIGREEAFKICHAVSKADKDAVGSVLREFFQIAPEGYRNKRADEEIAKARDKSQKAKASINARWNQRSTDTDVIRTYEERKPDVLLSNNQYPITKNQEIKKVAATPTGRRKGLRLIGDILGGDTDGR
jgi:uncharacterized protein YdaU (DUF1376 family)